LSCTVYLSSTGLQRPVGRPHFSRGRECQSINSRLAAEHEKARAEGLEGVLAALPENFVLAKKPLAFLSDRYLQFAKHRLFEL
jgi:hypothetical protein